MTENGSVIKSSSPSSMVKDMSEISLSPSSSLTNLVKVIPFCVAIPKTIELDDISLSTINQNTHDIIGMEQNPKGIVGTITVLNNQTAIVWFGWGDLILTEDEDSPEKEERTIGGGTYGCFHFLF